MMKLETKKTKTRMDRWKLYNRHRCLLPISIKVQGCNFKSIPPIKFDGYNNFVKLIKDFNEHLLQVCGVLDHISPLFRPYFTTKLLSDGQFVYEISPLDQGFSKIGMS